MRKKDSCAFKEKILLKKVEKRFQHSMKTTDNHPSSVS